MDKSRKYKEEEIIALSKAISQEEESFKWLMNNNCKELAALCDTLAFGNEAALNWLKENKFTILLAFVSALKDDDDDDALNFLLASTFKEWAATINVINDNEGAKEWLINFHLKHYLILAETIISESAKNSSSGSYIGGFNGGSGGGSGGGFGGFGGGSFGGGGTGGAW